MVSGIYIFLVLFSSTAPVLAQSDWAINFYTTSGCEAAQPHWARLFHSGYSGQDNDECIVITSDAAHCSVTYSGTGGPGIPGGVNVYSCSGPNSKGLSGAPLKSFGGGGSCDFYTDTECTQGHVHHVLTSYTGFSGLPQNVCYSSKSLLTTKYFQSFKCTNA